MELAKDLVSIAALSIITVAAISGINGWLKSYFDRRRYGQSPGRYPER